MANNTRGNGGLVEYHNYVSASLGAPLPRAVGSLFPGASSYRAVPRGDESYPLPPPGFLHTSELSLGCKLGWSNDKKRAAFPHSFDPSPRSSLNYHNDTTTSDAVSEHDAATSLVDWMLSDASMSSCRDEFAFKQQLAQRLETGGLVRVAKPGITMGAHPSQEEQMVAIEKCRHIATAGTGRGSWEGFKQTMQSIERGAIAAADAGGAVAFRRPDPRHELLSMLAQPVGLDRFVRSNPSASRSVPWEDAAPSTRAAAARPPLRATAAPRTAAAAAAAAAADATPWTELAVRANELRQSHRSLQAVCEGLRAELDAPSGAMVERRARRVAAPLQSASVSTAHVDRARLAPMYEVTVRGPLESDYSYKAISA